MSELPKKTVSHLGTYDDSWHGDNTEEFVDDPAKHVEDLRKAQFHLNRLEDER